MHYVPKKQMDPAPFNLLSSEAFKLQVQKAAFLFKMLRRFVHTAVRLRVFIPTAKERLTEAVLPGYQYLVRAGYISKASTGGVYMYLPYWLCVRW